MGPEETDLAVQQVGLEPTSSHTYQIGGGQMMSGQLAEGKLRRLMIVGEKMGELIREMR